MVRGENSLFFSTALDNSGLRSGALDAVGIVRGLGSSISKIHPFAALAVGAVSAFAIIGNAAYKMAASFESAMAEVRTIAGVNDAEFKKLGKDLIGLSTALGTETPDQLAKGLYEIIGAGYEAADALKILETATKAATAGVTTSKVAADGLTTILNSFRLSAQDAAYVADIMFATVDRGKISFEELASQISTVAPLAASSNFSFEQIGAALSTLTKQGVPAGVAMTQIRSAIIAVNEVLGSDIGKRHTLQEALQQLYDKSGGDQNKLKELAGRIEAVGAVLAIAGPNFKGATEDLEAMGKAAGSVNKNFALISGTTANQWEILRNRMKNTTTALGESLLSMSNGMAKFLNQAIEGSSLSEKQYRREAISLNDLKIELRDLSVPLERRMEIVEELQQKYPSFLSNIKNEGVLTSELNTALSGVNDQLLKRFQLEANREEAGKVALKIGERESEQAEAQLDARRELERVRKRSAAAREVLNKLEGRSITDQVMALKELSTQQFSYLDLYTEKIRDPGRELIKLRKNFADLTGQQKDMANGIIEFNIPDPIEETIAGDDKKGLDAYKEFLDEKKNAYDSYNKEINALGKERADEINRELIKESDNYRAFLNSQLELYKGNKARERAIAEAAASAGEVLSGRGKVDKLVLEVQPSVSDIQLSDNAVSNMIRKLQDQLSNSDFKGEGGLFDIVGIAEKQTAELNKIEALKKLKLEKLAGYEQTLSKETFAKRRKDILAEYDQLRKSVFDKAYSLLEKIPSQILDKAMQGTEMSFQNLNAATLGQLDKLQDKLKEISLDSASLLDMGLQKEQVEELVRLFDNLKVDKTGLVGTAQAAKIGDTFRTIGDVMSQAGDNISSAVGRMVGEIGNAISVIGDKDASGLQKAGSLVGLIVQAGGMMKDLGKGEFYKAVNDQKSINQALADQLAMEAKINEIRRERAEIERNSSAFLDSYYKDDFLAAIQKQSEGEKQLNEAMEKLAKNAVFTTEGIGKRLLFGKKKEDRDFSMAQILGNTQFEEYFATTGKHAKSRFFDPLSIFGGYSDIKVSKDALKKLQASFSETLSGMGKTSADMARFSTEEWLDFFTIMDEAGKITDKGTKEMLANAKAGLEDYNAAMEEMKTIISDFAGSLGDSLGDSLVAAFEDGTDAADKFMVSVNEIINKLFMNELIDSQFRGYFDKLQEDMKKSFEAGGDQSWIDDIKDFAGNVTPGMEAAAEAMRAFDKAMEEAGFEGFGSQKASGLAGAISTITEDTANILAGTLNSIRIDVANGLAIAQNSSLYLSQIVSNTSYNKHLQSIDLKMGNIETALNQFESRGL